MWVGGWNKLVFIPMQAVYSQGSSVEKPLFKTHPLQSKSNISWQHTPQEPQWSNQVATAILSKLACAKGCRCSSWWPTVELSPLWRRKGRWSPGVMQMQGVTAARFRRIRRFFASLVGNTKGVRKLISTYISKILFVCVYQFVVFPCIQWRMWHRDLPKLFMWLAPKYCSPKCMNCLVSKQSLICAFGTWFSTWKSLFRILKGTITHVKCRYLGWRRSRVEATSDTVSRQICATWWRSTPRGQPSLPCVGMGSLSPGATANGVEIAAPCANCWSQKTDRGGIWKAWSMSLNLLDLQLEWLW